MFMLYYFQTLQEMEEGRITRTKEFIRQSGDIERNVVPIINTCIDGFMKAADSIDATKVILMDSAVNEWCNHV